MSAFKWLTILTGAKKVIDWIIANFLNFMRREKLRDEKRKKIKSDYDKAVEDGDMGATLDSFDNGKRIKNQ